MYLSTGIRARLPSLIAIVLFSACGDAGGPSGTPEPGDIVFVQDGDIYSMVLAEGTPRRVATELTGPSWSPDGTMLAALRTGDEPAIFLLQADGDDVHQLTKRDWTRFTLSEVTWRPDGQLLTYSVRSIFSPLHLPTIYSINVDGTDEIPIEAEFYYDLQWSPDATRYTLSAISSEIVMVKRDGTGRFNLADGCCVDWSPDGSTIAYAANGSALHLITPEGTNDRALPGPAEGLYDFVPQWSPDGSKIAFATHAQSATFPMQVAGIMNADGTGRMVLAPGIQQTSSVDWSADGAHLAFTGYASAEDVAAGQSRLYVVKPDGTDLHVVAGPAQICCSVWRP